jgi:prolyl oligopeptidase
MPGIEYPKTPTVDQVDNFHGTLVRDPYRWLEDVDAPQTLSWIAAQNELTFSILEKIPARARIQARLTALWDFPKTSAPRKRGGRYFQMDNTGLQNQDVMFTRESLTDEKRLLLDPNLLSQDGTVALTNWEVSKDGRYLAYATSASGSDWQIWRVRDVEIGQDLPDVIEWSKFSGAAWLQDSSGFFYSRYDAPEAGKAFEEANYNQKLYFHRLGTPQPEDRLVYERPDQREWGFDGRVSDDGKYLAIHVWQGTDIRNRFFYQDLEAGGETIELIPELEANYHFIDHDGPLFYFRTDLDAPRGRVIAIDIRTPEKAHWRTIIPESDDVLENIIVANQQFVTIYLHNAYHQLKRFKMSGEYLGEIQLPGLGSIVSINDDLSLNGNREDNELFFTFHSFAHPPSVYRYDFEANRIELLVKPDIDFDFDNYQVDQEFATSKDGTRIPIFLVHRKDLQKNGDNPTLLYGYGGFSIPITPSFMVSRLVWLEMGGILAVATLRGGGEFGEEWHQAGSLLNKQNCFDDMIAAAEYLISEDYTKPERLAIEGRSNGGLLVGACMTQRPDLFGVALPAVGVMDMLRFHKFTIGWAWVSDYGSADDPQQFAALYKYSPLHNLKPGTHYPATLITTADHDDRVVPGHSFKFAAALQAAQAGDAPTLIRIQTKAGHGFGKPTAILIEEQTDILSFMVKYLDMRLE